MIEDEVLARVWEEGSLFALFYRNDTSAGFLVPLPEEDAIYPAIEGN